jgi:hypothetical protein
MQRLQIDLVQKEQDRKGESNSHRLQVQTLHSLHDLALGMAQPQ